MDVLWSSRHRQSNLVGNVLNINTGDWIRRDSGVGAGIDSYYEYVAKAYVLLGDEQYLSRWNTHYSSIMKYLGQVSTSHNELKRGKKFILVGQCTVCLKSTFFEKISSGGGPAKMDFLPRFSSLCSNCIFVTC